MIDSFRLLINAFMFKIENSIKDSVADWSETDENSPAFVKNKPEIGSVTIFTYLSNDDSFYLKDNPDEDFIFPSVAAATNPLNATKVTYDMLDEAMKKGVVLCDLTDYQTVSAMGSVSDSYEHTNLGTVVAYGKQGDDTYYEWFITTVMLSDLVTIYLEYGSQPR